MKKLGYQMNFAINLREMTWDEWYGPEIIYNMPPSQSKLPISFRDSLKIAEFDGHSEFQPESEALYILAYAWKKGPGDRTMDRKEWKAQYASYRKYMSQANTPDMYL